MLYKIEFGVHKFLKTEKELWEGVTKIEPIDTEIKRLAYMLTQMRKTETMGDGSKPDTLSSSVLGFLNPVTVSVDN